MSSFIPALMAEIRQRVPEAGGRVVRTVYFGGGTPSLLDPASLERILSAMHAHYSIATDAEITLEVNPDDLSASALQQWYAMGINRLSLGIQSFHGEDLSYLDRVHDQAQAQQAVDRCREAGFANLGIDLIYGIPGQDLARWEANLERFLSLGVDHLSAYALTLEKGTALDHFIRKGKRQAPEDDLAAGHFMALRHRLTEAGYEHYEVSNFARNGIYSRHNLAYWQGVPYLGFGPSAHSFDGVSRSWNVSRLGTYIEQAPSGQAVEGREVLGWKEHVNEYLMTSLRTMWGCRLARLEELAGPVVAREVSDQMRSYLSMGWAEPTPDGWRLSGEGLFHADGIAASLFVE